MKNVTTILGWSGVEPPDIRPMKRQAQYLFWKYRWFRMDRWFALIMRMTARGVASTLALAGLCWAMAQSGTVLRLFDPTAAVVDIGALSLVLLAVLALANFLAVSRWLLGLLWPVLRDYQRFHFSNNFKSLYPWQKITFYLVIFFGLLYAFVVCLVAVF